MVKVSVVLPVYNEEKYIGEAVDSILNQTFTDFEFIIIDDGSTDNTLSILQSYNDERIKIISRENKGLVPSLNEGISLAQPGGGGYIARMDADDVSLPARFEKQVNFLDENVDCVAVGSNMMTMDADGNNIKECCYPERLVSDVGKCPALAHPTAMIRKDAINSINSYRPYFYFAEDFDLWWRLEEIGNIHCLQEVLLRYRLHSSNVSLSLKQYRCQLSCVSATYCAKLRRSGKSDNFFDNKNLSKSDGFLLYKIGVPVEEWLFLWIVIWYKTINMTAGQIKTRCRLYLNARIRSIRLKIYNLYRKHNKSFYV